MLLCKPLISEPLAEMRAVDQHLQIHAGPDVVHAAADRELIVCLPGERQDHPIGARYLKSSPLAIPARTDVRPILQRFVKQ